jgi:hypothetical protein
MPPLAAQASVLSGLATTVCHTDCIQILVRFVKNLRICWSALVDSAVNGQSMIGQLFSSRSPLTQLAHYAVNKLDDMGLTSKALFWSDVVVVIDIAVQDSFRLLPGSSYSCCIRNLHALGDKKHHPVNIRRAHETLQQREWQLCKSTLRPNHSGTWA